MCFIFPMAQKSTGRSVSRSAHSAELLCTVVLPIYLVLSVSGKVYIEKYAVVHIGQNNKCMECVAKVHIVQNNKNRECVAAVYIVQNNKSKECLAYILYCKLWKRLAIFQSLTKLSLGGNNLFIPDQGEFGKWHTGWGTGKWLTFFYSVVQQVKIRQRKGWPCFYWPAYFPRLFVKYLLF
jgi:hypothetical protein